MSPSLRLLIVLVGGCALSLAAPASLRAQCTNPGDVVIGEDDEKWICKKKPDYEQSDARRFAATYCSQKHLVDADQRAIEALNFALVAERFDTFGDVAAAKKASFQSQVVNALLTQGLEATKMLANSAKSLNPYSVNKAAGMLEKHGLDHPAIVAALRQIARTKGKPAMAAAYEKFLQGVSDARTAWSTGADIAKDPQNKNLRLVLGALKIMQGNLALGLAITSIEMGENLAYLYYIGGEVDDLAAATDARLAHLGTLGGRLRAHVDSTRSAKQSWLRSLALTGAWPVCGQS